MPRGDQSTYCPSCQALVCKHKQPPGAKTVQRKLSPGMSWEHQGAELPRVRCRCGQLVFLKE